MKKTHIQLIFQHEDFEEEYGEVLNGILNLRDFSSQEAENLKKYIDQQIENGSIGELIILNSHKFKGHAQLATPEKRGIFYGNIAKFSAKVKEEISNDELFDPQKIFTIGDNSYSYSKFKERVSDSELSEEQKKAIFATLITNTMLTGYQEEYPIFMLFEDPNDDFRNIGDCNGKCVLYCSQLLSLVGKDGEKLFKPEDIKVQSLDKHSRLIVKGAILETTGNFIVNKEEDKYKDAESFIAPISFLFPIQILDKESYIEEDPRKVTTKEKVLAYKYSALLTKDIDEAKEDMNVTKANLDISLKNFASEIVNGSNEYTYENYLFLKSNENLYNPGGLLEDFEIPDVFQEIEKQFNYKKLNYDNKYQSEIKENLESQFSKLNNLVKLMYDKDISLDANGNLQISNSTNSGSEKFSDEEKRILDQKIEELVSQEIQIEFKGENSNFTFETKNASYEYNPEAEKIEVSNLKL
jgi:hypothetical protein